MKGAVRPRSLMGASTPRLAAESVHRPSCLPLCYSEQKVVLHTVWRLSMSSLRVERVMGLVLHITGSNVAPGQYREL